MVPAKRAQTRTMQVITSALRDIGSAFYDGWRTHPGRMAVASLTYVGVWAAAAFLR